MREVGPELVSEGFSPVRLPTWKSKEHGWQQERLVLAKRSQQDTVQLCRSAEFQGALGMPGGVWGRGTWEGSLITSPLGTPAWAWP